MARVKGASTQIECDKKLLDQFLDEVRKTMKAVKEFNALFAAEFLDEQKKVAKDLWIWVTRYNILDV